MATNYEMWNAIRLSERERGALELIIAAWQAGRPTDADHVVFQLFRAGWEPAAAQKWISDRQSEAPVLLVRKSREMLAPTLVATIALASNAAVREDLDDLERLVTCLHQTYDPDRPRVSKSVLASALDLAPDRLERLLHFTGISWSDDVVYGGNQPLYWTSFAVFLERSLPPIAPRPVTVAELPIEAQVEQVAWLGLGPYRSPTTLRLSPMTVLVGANGAGKTTALLALSFLRGLAAAGAKEADVIAERIAVDASELMVSATAELVRPGGASTEAVTWQLAAGLTTPRLSLTETLRRVRPLSIDHATAELATFMRGTGRWRDDRAELVEHTMLPGELALTSATSPGAHSQLLALRQSLRRWWIGVELPRRDLIPEKVRLPSSYQTHPESLDVLRRGARNVTGIKDLRLGESGEFLIQDARGVWLEAHLLSTGVVRAIEILSLLLVPTPPPLFALDEIENHLHGDLAVRLLDVMRSVSHRTRIVVTTHSARVLRCFKPSEVRLVRRDERGSSIVALDDDPRLRRLAEAGDLGALLEDGYFAGGM